MPHSEALSPIGCGLCQKATAIVLQAEVAEAAVTKRAFYPPSGADRFGRWQTLQE